MVIVARVALASTPQERFAERIEAIAARIDRLPDEAARAALDELEGLRRRVIGALASSEGFQADRLRQLTARIEGVMEDFATRYAVAIEPFQRTAVQLGRAAVVDPLVQSGLALGVPEIPRRLVEATLDYQADLIKGLTQDGTRRITQAIRRGAIEGRSVFEVMQDVAGSLEDAGPFASIAARAEAITRTELARLQAVAGQASLEESKRLVPDLLKQWKHSGNPRGRVAHMLADGQTREVEEFYEVAPAPGKPVERLLYPRDPRASAANSVMCGCLSLPFKADWPA
jgi:hypothetical protein